MHYRLDMMSLREHIQRRYRCDRVLVLDKTSQIASEDRRIAGYIRNMPGPEADKACNHFLLGAEARRVEQNEVKVALNYVREISSNVLGTKFQVSEACVRGTLPPEPHRLFIFLHADHF